MGGTERESVKDVRPVELPQLHQTELDIAGFVLSKRLAEIRNPRLDVLDGRVLEFGDVGGTHGGV